MLNEIIATFFNKYCTIHITNTIYILVHIPWEVNIPRETAMIWFFIIRYHRDYLCIMVRYNLIKFIFKSQYIYIYV